MATATAAPPDPFRMKASSGGGGDYDLCPAGNHPAILLGLIDLGTHEDEYKGKKFDARNVALVFELTAEMRPSGEPFVLAKQFRLAFTESSNLRKLVEGWRGKKFEADEEFDLTVLVDKPCLVNVSHRKSGDKTYHEIAGVTAVPRGMAVPKRTRDVICYQADPAEAPPEFDWLPYIFGESIADIVRRSREFKGGGAQPAQGAEAQAEDDIPF